MKRPTTIQQDFDQIGTIEDLTSVFEAIASLHIAQIKDKVQSSTRFFDELWGVYSQLRASKKEQAGLSIQRNGRVAVAAVTSDGGLMGDIDERIVHSMLEQPRNDTTDLYIIGSHGATLLAQQGVKPTKILGAPNVEKGESVRELAQLFGAYEKVVLYYQTYVSLMHQDIARIDLFSAVQTLGAESAAAGEVISSNTYVLEPSAKEIIEYMEAVMVQIALGQVMLESRLAQYASRFNAMYAAKSKATELKDDLGLQLHHSKRALADERIKEVLSGMKAMRRR